MIENLFPCELGDDGRIDHGGNDHDGAEAGGVAARLQQKRRGLHLTDSHSSLSGCRIWLYSASEDKRQVWAGLQREEVELIQHLFLFYMIL